MSDKTNDENRELCVQGENNGTKILSHLLMYNQEPRKLAKPEIDSELLDHPFHIRVGNLLKYQILYIEYSISEDGVIRLWLKLTIRFFVMLLILLFPIAVLTAILPTILKNTTISSIYILSILIVVALIPIILKAKHIILQLLDEKEKRIRKE